MIRRAAALAALAITAATAASSQERILFDGSLGDSGAAPSLGLPGGGLDYRIDHTRGRLLGTSSLFHSFSRFGLGPGDIATFTGPASIDYVFARVTGDEASRIEGTIRSMIETADLYLLNPRGVVFGGGARLELDGSFHASSAHYLRFGEERFEASIDGAVPTLDVSAPSAFGFLGGPSGVISLEPGAVLEVPLGETLRLVGGDLTIEGAEVSAPGGRIDLVGVASKGEVSFDEDGTRADGVTRFGSLRVEGESAVNSSGEPVIGPVIGQSNGGQPGSTDPPREGFEYIGSSNGFDFYAVPSFEGGAGDVFVRARDLVLVDSEIRAVTGSDESGGRIRVDLSGDLTIEKVESESGAGLASGTGVVVPLVGDFERLFAGRGAGGEISVRARNVTLAGGATITSVTSSSGPAGDVGIEARGEVVVAGRDASGGVSGIFANAQGAEDGDAGDIRIQASELRLEGGGGVFAQTTGDADAGDISIDVDRLEVRDTSQIDSSTSAQSLGRDASGTTRGAGGDIEIVARSSVLLSGGVDDREFARISTFSQERSVGRAGGISLATPVLEIEEGAGIGVTARGAGPAGDIEIDAGSVVLRDGGSLEARARSADGGNVGVASDGLVLLERGGRISAGVEAGRGGNVTIETADSVVLRDASSIDANSRDAAGGNVEIAADRGVFVEWPVGLPPYDRAPTPGQDSFVSASGADSELEGRVVIRSPEQLVQEQLTPPDPTFLADVAPISCAARRSGAPAGSFTVASQRGLPTSPEELLLAYDESGLALHPALPPVAASGATPALGVARTSFEGGVEAFRGGRVEQAAADLSRASDLFAEIGDEPARLEALRALAQAQQADGRFAESVDTLREALRIAEKVEGQAQRAGLLGSLGNAQLALGRLDAAEQQLSRGVDLAKQSGDLALAATLLNNLANLDVARAVPARALPRYQESAHLARRSSRSGLRAQALSNAARAALETGQPALATQLLAEASNVAAGLAPTHRAASIWVHVAASHQRLGGSEDRLAAHAALSRAILLGRQLDRPRLQSLGVGNLAALYAAESRSREALLLMRRAQRLAEEGAAPELLYRWYWREGQVLWSEGRASEALRSYRRALGILEESRPESRAVYGSAAARFRRTVAPVYLSFVEALIESSEQVADAADAQRLLVRARSVVEELKAAELRNYFRDECVAELDARTRSLSDMVQQEASRAAVVYPIVFRDGLELLVTLPSGLRRYRVPVARAVVLDTLWRYRDALEGVGKAYERPAQSLYEWLVRPYAGELAAEGIETLVFVPDGALRTVPMAALHDGERFLIERFAVAVAPGLELVDPRPLPRSNVRVMLAGLSQPVAPFQALEHVPAELAAVESRFGGRVLLDEQFVLDRTEAELVEGQPTIVHLASHAEFTGDPRTSFLLTYDGPLTMERLGELVQTRRFREPLELLVLSACETAVGDERAALGLAGVAVRSGARSALGTLWRVNDASTAALMESFYDELRNPALGRAEALRAAQRAMIASSQHRHPRHWSAFLLISNWL